MSIEEKLINAVSQHPYIFDPGLQDYKNVIKKDRTWRQIGRELNLDEDICRRKWKVLRGTYRRAKRGEILASVSGISPRRKKWRHFEAMSFLDGCTKSTPTLKNLEEVSANPPCGSLEDDTPSTSASPAPVPSSHPTSTPDSAAIKYYGVEDINKMWKFHRLYLLNRRRYLLRRRYRLQHKYRLSRVRQIQDDFGTVARQISDSAKQIADCFWSRKEETRVELAFSGLAKILNGAGMPENVELSVINEVQGIVFTAVRSWNQRQLENT